MTKNEFRMKLWCDVLVNGLNNGNAFNVDKANDMLAEFDDAFNEVPGDDSDYYEENIQLRKRAEEAEAENITLKLQIKSLQHDRGR